MCSKKLDNYPLWAVPSCTCWQGNGGVNHRNHENSAVSFAMTLVNTIFLVAMFVLVVTLLFSWIARLVSIQVGLIMSMLRLLDWITVIHSDWTTNSRLEKEAKIIVPLSLHCQIGSLSSKTDEKCSPHFRLKFRIQLMGSIITWIGLAPWISNRWDLIILVYDIRWEPYPQDPYMVAQFEESIWPSSYENKACAVHFCENRVNWYNQPAKS